MTIRRTAGGALAGLGTTLFMEYASTAFYSPAEQPVARA